MHVFKRFQLDSLIPFLTDLIDERFDIIGQLTEPSVHILLIEVVGDLRKDELPLLLLFNRHSLVLRFTLSHKRFLLVHNVDLVIVNANELMEHGQIGPGRQQRGYDVFFPFCDDQDCSLVQDVIALLLSELCLHLLSDFVCDHGTGR